MLFRYISSKRGFDEGLQSLRRLGIQALGDTYERTEPQGSSIVVCTDG